MAHATAPNGLLGVLLLHVGALAAAMMAGSIHGRLEGVLYPLDGGPRAGLWTHWATLVLALYLATLSLLGLLAPRAPRRSVVALALLPIALVLQDAASLHYQGIPVSEATWYAEIYGHNPLTDQAQPLPFFPSVPGWYILNALLSLALLATLIPLRATHGCADEPTTTGGV